MRAVVQRVSEAAVSVAGEQLAEIGAGLLVLVGVTHHDDLDTAAKLARKVAGLRILRDGDRDEAAADAIGAPALVVSQFTLYADTSSGRRPSWQQAAAGSHAEPLVTAFIDALRMHGLAVCTGRFGAMMAVRSVNDGPFTILLEA
ncbi:MAG: D-aminoacyl-tRNA deacylase [Actinomycetota bacterium]|nr:D-aminoacyl-tRNA deacylase [Actinomycetota bacterium]MDQ2955692.1 D-aminoacyl-tRNA deacylase [Actinomycetota bacterium]